MPNFMADIVAFHEKYRQAYGGFPRQLPPEVLTFRKKFLAEELEEYNLAATELEASLELDPNDHANIAHLLEKQLDALVDLVYVALGTAYLQGFDFDEAWQRVQAANMKKVLAGDASLSKRGAAFDVIKPPGWEPPSHIDLVENHAHVGP